KVKEETATQEAKLAPLQAQLAQARRDAAHAAQFKAQLESLQQAMPASPALAAFIRDANAIASASGVSWQSVTHAPPTPGVGRGGRGGIGGVERLDGNAGVRLVGGLTRRSQPHR